ncbi:MAG: MFS transporter [Paracoccaceae bacterium]|nr:MFS transporter [Paracoccaceae bacterium]
MVRFLLENRRWLLTGLLLTFASSFGQTWFISLFAGEIRAAYGLSDGEWGALYTVATLTSAALLLTRGSLADTVRLSRLAPLTALVFAAAAAAMALAKSVWLLGIAVFLLRFCGQGMFSHIAMTAMGRWFVATRGRAVAITGLGYSAGEALLPLPTVLLIGWIGWRGGWGLVAALIALVVAPLLVLLLAEDREPAGRAAGHGSAGLGGRHWRRPEVLRHWLFAALLPFLLTPGFIGTVIFFHQVHVAEVKGWSLAAMAPAYPAYAGVTVTAALAAGWAADRFGPDRLLPPLLIPMALSMLLLGSADSVWDWTLILAILGLTQGMQSAFWGAFLPHVYGTRHLGAVRALTVALMVVATAIGPGLTGLAIDLGVSFPEQGLALGLWCLALVPLGWAIRRRLGREAAATAQVQG